MATGYVASLGHMHEFRIEQRMHLGGGWYSFETESNDNGFFETDDNGPFASPQEAAEASGVAWESISTYEVDDIYQRDAE